ncbi:cation/H(+) antiporter 2-like isoform X2 [Carica papaya]|nr:cation/H(+) antiporter 2-like isoform X2 [Carica papaya]
MFLMGLEVDKCFVKRNLHKARIIACGAVMGCAILGAASSFLIMHVLRIHQKHVIFAMVFIMVVTNSASPLLFRVVIDMKLDNSNVGRLAICVSLMMEISLVLLFTIVEFFMKEKSFHLFLLFSFSTALLVIVNRHLVPWVNTWNPKEKYLTNPEVLCFCLPVLILAMSNENFGFSNIVPCFIIGLTFPREGKVARTLLRKFTYPVYEFILPIFYGYIGFQFNIQAIQHINHMIAVVLIVVVSLGAKIIGTLAACCFLKIPRNEAFFLACILNFKGNAAFLLIDVTKGSRTWWGPEVRHLLLAAMVINTLISGFIASYLLRKEEKYFAHSLTALEFHSTDSELRLLACVYTSHHASGAISLISASSGSKGTPITPQLVHLVELRKNHKAKLMYHQLEDGEEFSDEETYGGDDVLEINDLIDVFTKQSKVLIRPSKLVSPLTNLHQEMCSIAENSRVSILFLPFHKHQRIDGRLENSNEGIRTTNQKVLRHAPCSVGILVDRRQSGFQIPHGSESVQQVATLFFGGPDDREALALSKWISMHPQVNLTVVRFLAAPMNKQHLIDNASTKNHEILMSISTHETENERDNSFLEDFCNRYVVSGEVEYLEKQTSNGAETLAALKDMVDKYSLFVVGKGKRDSPITTGMNDWEECPELGIVGDLLASSEFQINASILVIQKHVHLDRSLLDS